MPTLVTVFDESQETTLGSENNRNNGLLSSTLSWKETSYKRNMTNSNNKSSSSTTYSNTDDSFWQAAQAMILKNKQMESQQGPEQPSDQTERIHNLSTAVYNKATTKTKQLSCADIIRGSTSDERLEGDGRSYFREIPANVVMKSSASINIQPRKAIGTEKVQRVVRRGKQYSALSSLDGYRSHADVNTTRTITANKITNTEAEESFLHAARTMIQKSKPLKSQQSQPRDVEKYHQVVDNAQQHADGRTSDCSLANEARSQVGHFINSGAQDETMLEPIYPTTYDSDGITTNETCEISSKFHPEGLRIASAKHPRLQPSLDNNTLETREFQLKLREKGQLFQEKYAIIVFDAIRTFEENHPEGLKAFNSMSHKQKLEELRRVNALLAGLAAISQTDSNFEDEKLTNETTMPDTSLALLSPDETKKTSNASHTSTGFAFHDDYVSMSSPVEIVRGSTREESYSPRTYHSPDSHSARTNHTKRLATTSGKRGMDVSRLRIEDSSDNYSMDNTPETLDETSSQSQLDCDHLPSPNNCLLFSDSQSPIECHSTMPSPDFNIEDSKSSSGVERGFDCHDTAETIDVTMIHGQKQRIKWKEGGIHEVPARTILKDGASLQFNSMQMTGNKNVQSDAPCEDIFNPLSFPEPLNCFERKIQVNLEEMSNSYKINSNEADDSFLQAAQTMVQKSKFVATQLPRLRDFELSLSSGYNATKTPSIEINEFFDVNEGYRGETRPNNLSASMRDHRVPSDPSSEFENIINDGENDKLMIQQKYYPVAVGPTDETRKILSKRHPEVPAVAPADHTSFKPDEKGVTTESIVFQKNSRSEEQLFKEKYALFVFHAISTFEKKFPEGLHAFNSKSHQRKLADLARVNALLVGRPFSSENIEVTPRSNPSSKMAEGDCALHHDAPDDKLKEFHHKDGGGSVTRNETYKIGGSTEDTSLALLSPAEGRENRKAIAGDDIPGRFQDRENTSHVSTKKHALRLSPGTPSHNSTGFAFYDDDASTTSPVEIVRGSTREQSYSPQTYHSPDSNSARTNHTKRLATTSGKRGLDISRLRIEDSSDNCSMASATRPLGETLSPSQLDCDHLPSPNNCLLFSDSQSPIECHSTMPSPDFNVKDSKSSLGIERRFDRHDTAETIDVTMIHEMIHEQKRQSKLKENLMSYPVAIPASEIFNGNTSLHSQPMNTTGSKVNKQVSPYGKLYSPLSFPEPLDCFQGDTATCTTRLIDANKGANSVPDDSFLQAAQTMVQKSKLLETQLPPLRDFEEVNENITRIKTPCTACKIANTNNSELHQIVTVAEGRVDGERSIDIKTILDRNCVPIYAGSEVGNVINETLLEGLKYPPSGMSLADEIDEIITKFYPERPTIATTNDASPHPFEAQDMVNEIVCKSEDLRKVTMSVKGVVSVSLSNEVTQQLKQHSKSFGDRTLLHNPQAIGYFTIEGSTQDRSLALLSSPEKSERRESPRFQDSENTSLGSSRKHAFRLSPDTTSHKPNGLPFYDDDVSSPVEIVRGSAREDSYSPRADHSPDIIAVHRSHTKRLATTSAKRGMDQAQLQADDSLDNSSLASEPRPLEEISAPSPLDCSHPSPNNCPLFSSSQSPILHQANMQSPHFNQENTGPCLESGCGADLNDTIETIDVTTIHERQRRVKSKENGKSYLQEIPANIVLKDGASFHYQPLNVTRPEKNRRFSQRGKQRSLHSFPDPLADCPGRLGQKINAVFDELVERNERVIIFSMTTDQICRMTVKLLLDQGERNLHSIPDSEVMNGGTLVVARSKACLEQWERVLRVGTFHSVLNHTTMPLSERNRAATKKFTEYDVVLTTFDGIISKDTTVTLNSEGHVVPGKIGFQGGWYAAARADNSEAGEAQYQNTYLSLLHLIQWRRIIFVDSLGRKCYLAKGGTLRGKAAIALNGTSRFIFFETTGTQSSPIAALRKSDRAAVRSVSAVLHLPLGNTEQCVIDDCCIDLNAVVLGDTG